jgi:hypothetical protein
VRRAGRLGAARNDVYSERISFIWVEPNVIEAFSIFCHGQDRAVKFADKSCLALFWRLEHG